MAVYIPIRKVAEDAVTGDYHFGGREVYIPDERHSNRGWAFLSHFGRLRIDKQSGEVILVSAMPEDGDHFCFARAARKVWLHWSKGELPRETCWAS